MAPTKNLSQLLPLVSILIHAMGCDAVNDLNHALNLIIREMNLDNFFVNTWMDYHNTLPIPVPNNCAEESFIPLDEADDSLKKVVESGVLRVGINPVAAGAPSIYSKADNGEISLNLTSGILDGYEIACSREGARRLGELYGKEIQPKYVLSGTSSYFEPLIELLEDDEADIIWSNMVVNDERAQEIDFTCNSFSTEVVIAASEKAGKEKPDPNGPPIKVACYNVFCSWDVPPPFVKAVNIQPSVADTFNLLANTTDDIEYVIGPYELLGFFFTDTCPTCSQVNMDPIASYVRSPGTLKTLSTRGETENEESVGKSSSTSIIGNHYGFLSSIVSVLAIAITTKFV